MAKNLWILTEERPKANIIGIILERFARDYKFACFIDKIRILPILDDEGFFTFTYEVKGLDSKIVNKVYLKLVSGKSSFVDFLIFYQEKEPTKKDNPIYAIEETKTDDSESRNTGIFQRATKFVYINFYYPQTRKILIYNIQIAQKGKATETNIFGTRCLLTLGVEIIGGKQKCAAFNSIEEVFEARENTRPPPRGNVPIRLNKENDKIRISGKLLKGGRLSHDPNIGALTLISATLRALGWSKKIEIVKHGLEQVHIKPDNKFIRIANELNISLCGIKIPVGLKKDSYWHYEKRGEKIATIFLHIVVENFSHGLSIYENHAGCERGYFITREGEHVAVEKYTNRDAYKKGNKKKIINIPDLVLIDEKMMEVVNIEGKKYENKKKGIEELNNFEAFEKLYIGKYYKGYEIIRTLVLYGSLEVKIGNVKISLILNEIGTIVINCSAPKIFKEAIRNLRDYWKI